MAEDDRWEPGPNDLRIPFIFVPHGAPDPVEWKAAHPEWVKFPATFVPRRPPEAADDWPQAASGPEAEAEAEAYPAIAELPPVEPKLDAVAISMAAMADPVGTLRRLGYDLAPQGADAGAGPIIPARYIPDERPDPQRPNAAMTLPASGKAFLYRHESGPETVHTHWPQNIAA